MRRLIATAGNGFAGAAAAVLLGMLAAASRAVAAPPGVHAVERLPAAPAAWSRADAGPVNRVAVVLTPGTALAATADVVCIYETGLAYRCRHVLEPARAGAPARVVVDVPDLDLGRSVVLRMPLAPTPAEVRVEIRNVPTVVHEIESVALAAGAPHAGTDAARAQGAQLLRDTATTVPAIATSPLGAPPRCDQPYAKWLGVSATDAVFVGDAGALAGSVVPIGPPAAGSRVATDNVPQWLFTHPAGATRAQFIAHYEFAVRIARCDERVLAPGAR